MASYGKTIRLFLVDGTPNGLTTAELSNWTGIGVKIPRIKLKEYRNRPEFQKPSVYLLMGKGIDNEDKAYIGEAEVVITRLEDHLRSKDFWNEVIFFSSKDKYLNKASVKYLENRLYELARAANRYTIEQNIPTRSELSEAEQAELEEFLDYIKLLTATLGHRIFETLEETVESTQVSKAVFYCKNTAGALAKGSPSTEGFVVYKDSLFMSQEQSSLSKSIRVERQKMIEEGLLVLEGNLYVLQQDYIFTSSSRAADAILTRSASGPQEWKSEAGIPLKQFEQS